MSSVMSRKEILAALRALDFRPRKNRGQNFLFDRQLLTAFIDDAGVPEGARVLEIGCGAGTLTQELLARGFEVIGVEIDEVLCRFLRERFSQPGSDPSVSRPGWTLVEADALASKNELGAELEQALASGGDYWLVANLPYAVATPIVQLLLGRENPGRLLGIGVLIQKEVASKWIASAGNREYGPAGAALQLLGRGSISRTVGRGLFWPPPKVDSAYYVWRPTRKLPGPLPKVQQVWRQLFQHRRKMLRAMIGVALPEQDPWWNEHGIDATARPEGLDPEQLTDLAEELVRRSWTG